MVSRIGNMFMDIEMKLCLIKSNYTCNYYLYTHMHIYKIYTSGKMVEGAGEPWATIPKV